MIDLRSDTVTKPTQAMRDAGYHAEVGDDVYVEDPTVNMLEKKAAEILGKEDALFVTSGVQGNQIAVLTHCDKGNEIILEEDSHVFYYEGAAISAFAGVQPRTIRGEHGAMDPTEVEAAIRPEDVHLPETGMICVENTHNRSGGAVVPLETMKQTYEVAKKHGIPLHLDGARLFNAVAATGISAKEYAAQTDTVQICLSKGLGAPVGSIIAGTVSFIQQARKWRKRLGGGLRQVGVIAAPAYIALSEMTERLNEDHANAKLLAKGIQEAGFKVANPVDTNIILMDIEDENVDAVGMIERLESFEIKAVAFGPNLIRFVTHYDVSTNDIEKTIMVLKEIKTMI
ncbi:low-specificity L-threonine aldolase [Halalkalibacillus sediminis]|uniref:Low-specificity L-threonine aldolase n=1 Tax=Halalkalibacillus sediminis TaxID=2018042 RepID=A0A2I0QSD7_9BACI|nr:low-specificity L-threonine aldolase [Halalkalibacillus sediminis]PKR77228.1 low-specificity L-threonine aldolase [Halalkalibacillus sediminis]